MKKYVKLAVTSAAIGVLSLSLVGCAGTSATTTTAASATEEKVEAPAEQTEKEAEAPSSDEVYGKITAVSGTEVTLALGTMDMAQGGAPTGEAPTGEAPTGEASTGEAPTGEAPTGEAPTGEAPTGEAPAGEAPAGEASTGGDPTGEAPTGEAPRGDGMGNGKIGGSFIASGEEINTEIDGDVTIKVMQDGQLADGTIADLTEDTVVKITYDDQDKIIELQVIGGNAMDNKEK